MPDRTQRFPGSLLALVLGDALGAPHEGGVLERLAWRALTIHRPGKLFYTDDTDMVIGCLESLIQQQGFDVGHMAMTWARRASATRGYGGGAIRCLRLIRNGMPWMEANRHVYPKGSYGNGAAMRVAPLALWLADDNAQLTQTIRLASSVTHAHPLGIDGALVVARAVAAASRGASADQVFHEAAGHAYDTPISQRLSIAEGMLHAEPDHVRAAKALGNGIVAHESIVTALLIACWFYDRPLDEWVGFCIAVGGDVDTIAAMAGSIWGAHRGTADLPKDLLARLEDGELIESLAQKLTTLPVDGA